MFPSPHGRCFGLQSPLVAEQVAHLLVACLPGRAGSTQHGAKRLSFSLVVSEGKTLSSASTYSRQPSLWASVLSEATQQEAAG